MYKVLIVEDDPMVAMINEEYVKRNKNFLIAYSCRNGQDAIKFLEKENVDLIVLDVFMPYMDGIQTLKKIREMKISSEAIMVTAANDVGTLEESMHLGVIDYLVKPFAYERFQVALEKFISKYETLKCHSVLDQKSIDTLMIVDSASKENPTSKKYPKGIQEKTLNLILEYFCENRNWQTGDVVAEKLSLSSVTIRHYMTFLVSNNLVKESINYETGGRPSILYKLK